MRRFSIFAIVFMFVTAVCLSCASTAQAEISKRTLKLAHVLQRDSGFDVGSTKFKELVEERSGGKITVQLFPGDMSGDEVEITEMTRAGNVDIAWLSTGSFSAFVKDIMVLDLPFLFRDADHVNKVVTGPVGEEILKKFEGTRLVPLAFAEDGWREITNNLRPINNLDDLKGLRIRIMMNDMNADMYKALGAVPTPIPYGETYSSMQTGLVHGQDNGVIVSETTGFLAIQPHVALIHHFYASGLVIMGERLWNRLSPEEQQLIKQAAIEAGQYQRDWSWQAEADLAKKLEAEGKIKITYPSDRDAWVKAVQPVYDKYFAQYPHWKDWVEKIRNTK